MSMRLHSPSCTTVNPPLVQILTDDNYVQQNKMKKTKAIRWSRAVSPKKQKCFTDDLLTVKQCDSSIPTTSSSRRTSSSDSTSNHDYRDSARKTAFQAASKVFRQMMQKSEEEQEKLGETTRRLSNRALDFATASRKLSAMYDRKYLSAETP